MRGLFFTHTTSPTRDFLSSQILFFHVHIGSEHNEYVDNDVIGYYHNKELVAFSIMRVLDDSNVEAVQFAWDYKNPELRLGIESLQNECAIYKSMDFEYIQLGEAQEYFKQFGVPSF